MDISTINSLYSRLFNSNANSTIASSLGSNFADYFLNATSAKDAQGRDKTNSLFDDLSGFGTSSALQGLLSGQGNNSPITSYLQATTSGNATSTDTFSTYLQSNFQAQQLTILSGAKEKLAAQVKDFEEAMGDNPTEAMKYRLEQMQKNSSTVENYLADKQSAQGVQSHLMQQLQSSSAFSPYLMQQKTFF